MGKTIQSSDLICVLTFVFVFWALSFLTHGPAAAESSYTEVVPFSLQLSSIDSTSANETEVPIIISEILASSSSDGTDANGDGLYDESEDAFIELVNNGSAKIDLSGWKLMGNNVPILTFPAQTVLAPGRALVIFGGGDPAGDFGGALVLAASSWNLTGEGGQIEMRDESEKIILDVTYEAVEGEGQSIIPDPENERQFLPHRSITGQGGAPFSPGMKTDGTPYGPARHAYSIQGSTGWHFITAPGRDSQFGELLSGFRSQGIPGSNAPASSPGDANIYSWNEKEGAFESITSMEDIMRPGRGYMIHIYEDDNLNEEGIQGGFPKTVPLGENKIRSPVRVPVRSVDANGNGSIDSTEGFNLLANPFGEAISVDAVIDILEDVNPNINAYVYIWDQNRGGGNGSYVPLAADGSGEQIGPYQAFFIRFTADNIQGEVSFERDDLIMGDTDFGKLAPAGIAAIDVNLESDTTFDTYRITFSGDGTPEEDRLDAYKLFSMNDNAISLFSRSGDDVKLAKNALPDIQTLNGELRISLAYSVPDAGEYTLSWGGLADIPGSVELQLVDREAKRIMDMRIAGEYSFSVNNIEDETGIEPEWTVPQIGSSEQITDNSRFELLIKAATAQEDEPEDEVKEKVVLSPNYPNPFTSQTTMDLELQENMHVKMTVWNIVGQKVGTMADQMMSEGDHTMTWNSPVNMPSGIYLCKVEAGGKVITRKMTLVK